MKQWLQLALMGALLAAAAFAQPSINKGGIVNAASSTGPGLPNSGIARGSMFVVYGKSFGPASLVQASSYPLPTTLGGTSIKVTVGGTTVDAIMVYSSASQVAAILPSSTPLGTGTMTVTYNGQTSATEPITVVANSFGMFTLNQAGSGPAVIQNANTSTDLRVNTVTESAKPGQLVILWGTGLGAVQGNEAAGPLPGALTVDTKVYVGGQSAAVTYAGRSGCCAGVDQIVFTVPSGIEGCYVPVVVQAGGVVSNFGTMAIAGAGGSCSDPNGFSATDLGKATSGNGLRTGTIDLSRISTSITVPILGSITSASETANATFSQYTLQTLASASAQAGFQTVGSCVVYSFSGTTPALPTDPVMPTYLNAGTLTLTGPNGLSKTFTMDSTGNYSLTLSSATSGIPGAGGSSTPVLVPGNYTVTGSGGSGANAVGSFTAQLTIPAAVNWTNQDAITNVVRANGQNITWTGGDPNGYVVIYGASVGTAASAGFYCTQKTSAGQFTIPSYVTASMPVSNVSSAGGISIPSGFLGVGSTSNPARFTATGLDIGQFAYLNLNLKSVNFQ